LKHSKQKSKILKKLLKKGYAGKEFESGVLQQQMTI
jgi:hypothetical protein